MLAARTAPFYQLLGLLPEVDVLEVLRIALARHAADRPDLVWTDGADATTVDVRVLDSTSVEAAVAEALEQQQTDTAQIYEAVCRALLAEVDGNRQAAVLELVRAGEEREQHGRFASALRFYRAALEASGPLPDRKPQILALRRIGRVQLMRGDPGESERCYQRSLSLAKDLDLVQDEVIAWTGLGNLSLRRGAWTAAESSYRSGIERARAAGNLQHELAHLWTNIAWALAKQSRVDEAAVALRDAMPLWETLDSPDGRANWHSARGHIFWDKGNFEAAKSEYLRAIDLGRDPIRKAAFQIDLSNLLLDAGEMDEARRWGRAAEASALAASAVGYVAEVYRGLGNIARADGEEAVPLYEKSLELSRHYGLPLSEAETLMAYAALQATTGNGEEAQAFLERAIEILAGLGADEDARRARMELAELSQTAASDTPTPLAPG